jgi:hypothetical protein
MSDGIDEFVFLFELTDSVNVLGSADCKHARSTYLQLAFRKERGG